MQTDSLYTVRRHMRSSSQSSFSGKFTQLLEQREQRAERSLSTPEPPQPSQESIEAAEFLEEYRRRSQSAGQTPLTSMDVELRTFTASHRRVGSHGSEAGRSTSSLSTTPEFGSTRTRSISSLSTHSEEPTSATATVTPLSLLTTQIPSNNSVTAGNQASAEAPPQQNQPQQSQQHQHHTQQQQQQQQQRSGYAPGLSQVQPPFSTKLSPPQSQRQINNLEQQMYHVGFNSLPQHHPPHYGGHMGYAYHHGMQSSPPPTGQAMRMQYAPSVHSPHSPPPNMRQFALPPRQFMQLQHLPQQAGVKPAARAQQSQAPVKKPRGPLSKNNVYAGNFPAHILASDLELVFSAFGKINSSIVLNKKTSRGLGMGFVEFDDAASAAQAVQALDKKTPFSKHHVIDVRFAPQPNAHSQRRTHSPHRTFKLAPAASNTPSPTASLTVVLPSPTSDASATNDHFSQPLHEVGQRLFTQLCDFDPMAEKQDYYSYETLTWDVMALKEDIRAAQRRLTRMARRVERERAAEMLELQSSPTSPQDYLSVIDNPNTHTKRHTWPKGEVKKIMDNLAQQTELDIMSTDQPTTRHGQIRPDW